MFRKGNKIYSILRGKCPRCHQGNFFKYPFGGTKVPVEPATGSTIHAAIFSPPI